MTIAFRLRMGAAIMAAAIAVFCSLIYVKFEVTQRVIESARAISGVLRDTQDLLTDVVDAETGQRGFVITGEERYLEPYRAALQVLPGRLEALRAAAAGSALRIRIDRLDTLVSAKLAELAETIGVRRAQGREAASLIVMEDRGRTLMDGIRQTVAEISGEQEEQLAANHEEYSLRQERMILLTLAGGGMVVLVIFGTMVRTVQSIRRPVRLLTDGIRRIGGGDFTHPIELHGGRNELSTVASAFNHMTSLLSAEQENRRAAEMEIERSNGDLRRHAAELEARTRTIDVLARAAHRLQGCRTEEEFAEVVRCFAPQVLPSASGALYLLSNSRSVLHRVAAWGDPAGSQPEFAPTSCWGLRRGQPHHVDESDMDVVCPHIGVASGRTYRCIPLIAQGETVGLLYLENASAAAATAGAEGSTVNPQDIEVLSENIALALVNLRLRDTLRNQSIRDPLTGLFNRRYLEEAFDLDLARAARSGTPLSVLMLDVDHFKRFNDTFGHEAGDTVLKQIGRIFSVNVRRGDVACRYGGEEFTILMPGAGAAEARQRAEHIAEAVRSLALSHEGRALGPITISVGVATAPHDGSTADMLLAAADSALYAAKRNGRDRIEGAPVMAAVQAHGEKTEAAA
ncbi:MAG TPA: diguanylate cyclase [Stellaceae bacterium]|jgi:diguanylate cyclase (GGDEF)-like protein